MARVEVITGPERRRRWSDEQKRAIVTASFAPGAVVSEVACRADVSSSQIYRWRQEFRAGAAGFAQVLIAPVESPTPTNANGVPLFPSRRQVQPLREDNGGPTLIAPRCGQDSATYARPPSNAFSPCPM